MRLVPLDKTPWRAPLPVLSCEEEVPRSQEVGSHRTMNLPGTSSCTSSLQNCEQWMSALHKPPVHDLQLQQPEWTRATVPFCRPWEPEEVWVVPTLPPQPLWGSGVETQETVTMTRAKLTASGWPCVLTAP